MIQNNPEFVYSVSAFYLIYAEQIPFKSWIIMLYNIYYQTVKMWPDYEQ